MTAAAAEYPPVARTAVSDAVRGQLDPVAFLINEARTNFAAFVSAVHKPRYKHSVFSAAVCQAVDRFVADVIAGKRPVLVLTAPPQHGKLLAHETPVLTANRGWVTHGALQVGDSVFRPDGSTSRVLALSAEAKADHRVVLRGGEVIWCHGAHEWTVERRGYRTSATMETREMLARGLLVEGEKRGRGVKFRFAVPRTEALRTPVRNLPLHPYVLGCWLGDGVRTKAVLTSHPKDAAVSATWEALGYPRTNCWAHKDTGVLSIEHASIRDPLRQLGLFNEGYANEGEWRPKCIPDVYFLASIEQRLQLMAGLIDTDGYVYRKNGRVTFSTCEPELARDVARLAASLGWTPTTTWFAPTLSSSGVRGTKPVAQVCFQPDTLIPCALERKQLRNVDAVRRTRAIVSIERDSASMRRGRCIQIEHDDGLYLVGNSLVPTHNSSLISRCLPPYLFGRLTGELPAVRIGCASYAHSLAQRNRRDAQSIMTEPIYREIFPHTSLIGFRGYDNATDGLEVPGGGALKGVGIGGGLTGFSLDCGIIDDAVKNAQEALSEVIQERNRDWFDAVFTTRLQQRSGTVIIGTPWSANDLIAHVRKTFGGSPNFTLLAFPALNEPEETGYDPALPRGALVPHLHSEAKLREMKARMSHMWWASMFQQRPLADFGAIFKRQYVRHYKRAELAGLQFVQKVMSVDATFKEGKKSDYVAVGVWGKTADNRVFLLGFRREQLGFMATAQAIADLKGRFPEVRRIYIEEAANGAALIDMLKKHYPTIEGVPPLGSKEARWHAVSWAWNGGHVFLPDPAEEPGIAPWVDEITSVPDAPNDDTADCMAIALQQVLLRSPIAALITKDVLRMAAS